MLAREKPRKSWLTKAGRYCGKPICSMNCPTSSHSQSGNSQIRVLKGLPRTCLFFSRIRTCACACLSGGPPPAHSLWLSLSLRARVRACEGGQD
jgi:hypothetical protein